MDFPAYFVKNGQTKVAHNAADAVKAKFDGFKLQQEVVAPELETPAHEQSLADLDIPKPVDPNALESEPAPAEPTELAEAPKPAKPGKPRNQS